MRRRGRPASAAAAGAAARPSDAAPAPTTRQPNNGVKAPPPAGPRGARARAPRRHAPRPLQAGEEQARGAVVAAGAGPGDGERVGGGRRRRAAHADDVPRRLRRARHRAVRLGAGEVAGQVALDQPAAAAGIAEHRLVVRPLAPHAALCHGAVAAGAADDDLHPLAEGGAAAAVGRAGLLRSRSERQSFPASGEWRTRRAWRGPRRRRGGFAGRSARAGGCVGA